MEFIIFLIGGLWLLMRYSSESAAKKKYEKVTTESRKMREEYKSKHLPDCRVANELDTIAKKNISELPLRVQDAIAEIKKASPGYDIGIYEKRWLVYALSGYCAKVENIWYVTGREEIDMGRIETLRQVTKLLNEYGVYDVVFVKRTGNYNHNMIEIEEYGMMDPFIRDFEPIED